MIVAMPVKEVGQFKAFCKANRLNYTEMVGVALREYMRARDWDEERGEFASPPPGGRRADG
jgi:hypothetical protein